MFFSIVILASNSRYPLMYVHVRRPCLKEVIWRNAYKEGRNEVHVLYINSEKCRLLHAYSRKNTFLGNANRFLHTQSLKCTFLRKVNLSLHAFHRKCIYFSEMQMRASFSLPVSDCELCSPLAALIPCVGSAQFSSSIPVCPWSNLPSGFSSSCHLLSLLIVNFDSHNLFQLKTKG